MKAQPVEDAGSDAARADVWLWRARYFKTRALAAAFVSKGRLRLRRGALNQRVERPGFRLRVDDVLVFMIGERLHTVRIRALGTRRGPATEAQGLYEVLPPRGAPNTQKETQPHA